MPRLSLQVALGVGAAGALVDVSSYARLTDGISRRWGRTDAFYGAEPGTFSFVLDNADGRFTPENPNSPLSTTLTEGMAACISVEGRLTAGTVRSIEPEFPSGEAAWSRVRVSCDDALGTLSRTRLLPLPDQLVEAAGVFGFYKFDDDVTSAIAVDSGPLGLPPIAPLGTSAGVVFGASPLPFLEETQAAMGATPGGGTYATPDFTRTFDYSPTTGGHYGFWVTVDADSLGGENFLQLFIERPNASHYLQIILNGSPFSLQVGAGSGASTIASGLEKGRPYRVDISVNVVGANVVHTVYLDGVSVGTRSFAHGGASSAADLSPQAFVITPAAGSDATAYQVSRFSHTRDLARDFLLKDSVTLGGALLVLDAASPGVSLDALPTLWDALVQLESVVGDSALDLLNLILETEQGYVHCETSGTLTNPTEVVVVRGRDRPETVTATFDVEDELSGAPMFIRDITNLVATVRVDNPDGDRVTVVDSSLSGRAGNASDTVALPLTRAFDMRAWAQDRINRGANTTMQIQSVVVDAMTTPTDRSADLLALVPGDRVQFTGLPDTQLGFDTWDGWFLGAEETHTIEEHSFALYFQPVLPPVAKYDTAKYMASGEITTNGAWLSGSTTVLVKSSGAGFSATGVPYVMQVDDEQINVTAVTGAAATQTLTVTRGVNGTTATTHAGDTPLVGPIPVSIYAF